MHACIREQQSVSLTGVCVGDLFLLSYVDCIDILSLPPFNNKLTWGSHDDTPTHTDMEQSESPNICPQALSNHYPHHGFTPSCFVYDSPFSLEQWGVSVVIWLQVCHQQTCASNSCEKTMLCCIAPLLPPSRLPNSFCLLGIIYQQNINFVISNTCLPRNIFAIKIGFKDFRNAV